MGADHDDAAGITARVDAKRQWGALPGVERAADHRRPGTASEAGRDDRSGFRSWRSGRSQRWRQQAERKQGHHQEVQTKRPERDRLVPHSPIDHRNVPLFSSSTSNEHSDVDTPDRSPAVNISSEILTSRAPSLARSSPTSRSEKQNPAAYTAAGCATGSARARRPDYGPRVVASASSVHMLASWLAPAIPQMSQLPLAHLWDVTQRVDQRQDPR
ncbi:hypothetical protein HRbin26_02054 [bacterium HR26]|nr:hypothetical protein HRbin26_02054 [bacterium HR26]